MVSVHPPVLVVEDEAIIRMMAMEGFADAGFEVLEADCAEQALQVLESRPDVLVLFTDVNMPGKLDGVQLAQLVHERWPGLRIVVTSGKGWPPSDALPGDGCFVPKPYRADQVASMVRRLVS